MWNAPVDIGKADKQMKIGAPLDGRCPWISSGATASIDQFVTCATGAATTRIVAPRRVR
jgi:hypothetical protein